ncbi:MAG: bifunctional adenosylcobinamide kinase/adenosylcobinamide-phosphate guanylyltransferase [Litorilinea sp.]
MPVIEFFICHRGGSPINPQLTFLLGGARSGKSAYAETLAQALAPGGDVLYVATAQAWDADMQARIARHRADRPPQWRTVEAAHGVGAAIGAALAAEPAAVVLLDCLTLLTSNVLVALPETISEVEAMNAMQDEMAPLLATFAHSQATWIVVSNEVGLGIVPAYPLGRRYRDVLGRVNQQVAAAADQVLLLVAGLPLQIKPAPAGVILP